MSNLIPFAFEEHLVRSIMHNGAPWFVGADVCRCLGLVKPENSFARLDSDEKDTRIEGTPGGPQSVTIVSEPGVYRLVFRSRKPEAERFKRWLAHDVLPALRRAGYYGSDATTEPNKFAAAPSGEPPNTTLANLHLVREARLLFGPERARRLWSQVGLPPVPPPPPTLIDEAQRCLRHLLAVVLEDPDTGMPVRVDDLIEKAMDSDPTSEMLLMEHGLRIDQRADGFNVANRHPHVIRFYRASPWAEGQYVRTWKRLPGVETGRQMRFKKLVSNVTFFPAEYLDRPPT